MTLKNWKDAGFIFITDLRRDWSFLIMNVVIMGYFGLMIGEAVNSGEQVEIVMSVVMDIMVLFFTPMIGFLFTRRNLNYLKEDSYSQMLMYFRSLPIPTEVVLLSRYIQMGAAIIFNGLILYSVMYFFVMNQDVMNAGEYIVFILTWIGFAIMINALYIHFEYLGKGRTYFWLTLLVFVGTGIIPVIVAAFGGNIVSCTIQYSVKYGYASPLMWGMLIAGLIMLRLVGQITKRKMDQRSLV